MDKNSLGYTPANSRQIDGTHYRDIAKGEQHWDMMWRLFREAWFIGCITKYLFRYRKKNGLKDLDKARHYLDKLIELEEAETAENLSKENTNPYLNSTDKRVWHFGYLSKCVCGADYPNMLMTSDVAHVTCQTCILRALGSITQQDLANFLGKCSETRPTDSKVWHLGHNGVTMCRQDYPNIAMTEEPVSVNCQKCIHQMVRCFTRDNTKQLLEYWDPTSPEGQNLQLQIVDVAETEEKTVPTEILTNTPPPSPWGSWAVDSFDSRHNIHDWQNTGIDPRCIICGVFMHHSWKDNILQECMRCGDAYKGQPSEQQPCNPWKLENKFEPCCECGEDYPRRDLIAGEVFCAKCRVIESLKLKGQCNNESHVWKGIQGVVGSGRKCLRCGTVEEA